MTRTRWAIVGPGDISGYFARALPHSQHGVLHAVGSSSPERAAAFAKTNGANVSGLAAEVITRDDVDAVYIGTVHPLHAEFAIAALEAGKAVLCEKPVTPTPQSTAEVLAAAARSGRPFLEAYKYRFGPHAERLRELVKDGAIGRITGVEATFGFASTERTGRLFEPGLAGGAILDIGGYTASFAIGVAKWAGADIHTARVDAVEGVIGGTGVDDDTVAHVGIGGIDATLRASIVRALPETATLRGTSGTITLPSVWGTRAGTAESLELHRDGESAQTMKLAAIDPFAAEADAVSLALAEGGQEVPEMTWGESAVVAQLLEDWRRALD